ncbi:MAG: alpha/beta hydrolase [Galactobacter sp.]
MSVTPEEMSVELRNSGVDFAADASQLRVSFEGMLEAAPLRDDVEYSNQQIAGVPVVITTPTTPGDCYFVYAHGGGFSAGTAKAYSGFSATISAATNAVGISVEYRRSPEAPFPAGLDDVVAVINEAVVRHGAGRVAVIGDSAGGGLVISALVALRDQGAALPSCAAVLSPWVDLTCSSSTMTSKSGVDPSLSPEGLRRRASEYANGVPANEAMLSPIFGDLRGLPPVLIQVGTDEILLDDSLALATALGRADVDVNLQVRAHLMHVFPSFAGLLTASDVAVDDLAAFVELHTDQEASHE